jgi:4'-phosphopantetheinyl transferase
MRRCTRAQWRRRRTKPLSRRDEDPAAWAAGSAAGCILRSGHAVAVLADGVGDDAHLRTVAAQQSLRRHTGRSDIVIERRPSGRPRLAPPYPELALSLSHRGDLLLAAFSPGQAVGADIEIDAPEIEAQRLAADHFSAGEAKALACLGQAAARDLFLRLWVAKEAALKVSGRGIFDGVDEPDLAHHLGRVASDGAEVRIGASARLPPLSIVTRRVELPGRTAIYCGLAAAV